MVDTTTSIAIAVGLVVVITLALLLGKWFCDGKEKDADIGVTVVLPQASDVHSRNRLSSGGQKQFFVSGSTSRVYLPNRSSGDVKIDVSGGSPRKSSSPGIVSPMS